MYSTHARERLEELFSTAATAWLRFPHHWEKTGHYENQKPKTFKGLQISTSPIQV